VALATFPRHAAVSRPLAIAGTAPVVAGTAAAMAWLVLAAGRSAPFAGDFGLAGFWIATAMSLGAVVFGLVAWRLGVVWRWSALALAIGTAAGYLGVDRLRLTSAEAPTAIGSIALAGLGLAAAAWVALGLELALPAVRRPRRPATGSAR
jgi:hypothetical protein